MRSVLLLLLLAPLAGVPRAMAAELRLGRTNTLPGAAVSVAVTYNGPAGAAVQFDVRFDPSAISLGGVAAGDSLAGHGVDWQQLAPGHCRVMAYSSTNGVFASGVIARLSLSVSALAPDGVLPLTMNNTIVAKSTADPVLPLVETDGAVVVSSAQTIESIALQSDGHARITIAGLPGRAFTLQGSPDLFHWANLGLHTNVTGLLNLTTARPPRRDAYFYRTLPAPATNAPVVPAPSLTGARLLADGRMVFQVNSIPGSAWRVEGSSDLYHWGNYGVVTNRLGALSITNLPFGRPLNYFHRIEQP